MTTSPTAPVQVVVRIRPMNTRENLGNTLPVITASTSDRSVTVIKGTGSRQVRSSYQFDNVFGSFSTQEEVYEATIRPVIVDVMNGYESTIFAYGQTGTGKTHTMEGDINDKNGDNQGVIPRSAVAIFEELKKDKYSERDVTCSYLEIYNEELCDLCVDNEKTKKKDLAGLKIMEDAVTGTFCKGLSEHKVSKADEREKDARGAGFQRALPESEPRDDEHTSAKRAACEKEREGWDSLFISQPPCSCRPGSHVHFHHVPGVFRDGRSLGHDQGGYPAQDWGDENE